MYIKVDKYGEYGFYPLEIYGEKFCKNECIKITDEFYDFLLENQGKYLIDTTSVVDKITENNLIERLVETIGEYSMPSQEERIGVLEKAMLDMILGGV